MDMKSVLLEQMSGLFESHNIYLSAELKNDLKNLFCGFIVSRQEDEKLPNIRKRIEHFIAAKRVDGLSERSLGNYQVNLNQFAGQVDKNVMQINTEDIREYMVYLMTQRHLKDSSMATHVNTLRSFFSWLQVEELILKNPMLKIKSKKLDKRNARHGLSAAEMEQLRDACRNYRENAMLELYYSSGCRLSELADATFSDLNLQDRSLVVRGKGNKVRTVYFSSRAKFMLSEYRKEVYDSKSLFCSCRKPHDSLGTRAIQQIIRKIGERTTIGKRIHPHLLRHTFATDLINKGIEITVLQTLLGHSEPGTTLIYAEISTVTTRRSYDKIIA